MNARERRSRMANSSRRKKKCSRKWRLLAFAFFVLQVELDSPMPPIGLESPSHSIRQPTFFMLPCHPSMQVALGKMVALLKKPKIAKSECATAMTLALQAIKAGKPLKSSFNKALKA